MAVPGIAGSARRGDFPSMEKSRPGSAIWSLRKSQGAAGGSPLLEPTSTAPFPIQHRHPRAAQALFLGPQAQVSPPADQPSCPLPELGAGEFAPISSDGGMGRLLPSSSVLFQELSHSTLSAYTQGCPVHLQRKGPEWHFQLQSCTPTAGDRDPGQRRSSALPSW